MKIKKLKINHIEKPMGYQLNIPVASYIVEDAQGTKQARARILVATDQEFNNVVYDTGESQDVSSLGTKLIFTMKPRTRYYWKVKVWDEIGNSAKSEIEWFETGLMEEGFKGQCITPDFDPSIQPIITKEFILDKEISKARLYICGLGLYEVYINDKKVGNEVLTPYVTVYKHYVQYQTYDIEPYLCEGKNTIEVLMGDGWYKGLFGYRQNDEYRKNKVFELLADLIIEHKDNSNTIIATDLSWKAKKSKVVYSDIYNGETYDDTFDNSREYSVTHGKLDKSIVSERLSIPVIVKEKIKPVKLIKTSKSEYVLDMGQNMVGWVAFKCREKAGTHIDFDHGEVLQDGCFYNANLRTAKAHYKYISNGEKKVVRPHFTFFGFRYVKITGVTNIDLNDFWGEVVYSDLDRTGYIETGDTMVNQLFSNALWGQKGNFLDLPTDCPQRDERLGWTGDAQIFSGTACLNMDCYAFFRKYLNDITLEQKDTGGLVPQYVPSVGRNEKTSTAWGDAAVVIPWNMYKYYGDPTILEEQFDSMVKWIKYIDRENEKHQTNPNLWQNGFHYGDWLALDGGYYHMPTGGTDVFFVSSAYFYYSTKILAQVAGVLHRHEEEKKYLEKAMKIKEEIQHEYFTKKGKLCIDTQTAYILTLFFDLVEDKEHRKVILKQFVYRLRKDDYYLSTGFVGTPYILMALSENGYSDIAYRLLLNEDYPGWLHPITLGATTMWERWNSILPDGSMSDTGMNSLNHYAYGAVLEWMYLYMMGIQVSEECPGFKKVTLNPHINSQLKYVDAKLHSKAGTYEVFWEIRNNDELHLVYKIPFDAQAEAVFPYSKGKVSINNQEISYKENDKILLTSGTWEINYSLRKDYRSYYSLEDSVNDLYRNKEIKEYLFNKIPMLSRLTNDDINVMTLKEMSELPFFLGIGTRLGMEEEVLKEVSEYISTFKKD